MERWAARQPVLVRGLRSRMQWGPEVMQRATREQGSKRFNIDSTDTHLQVRDEGRYGVAGERYARRDGIDVMQRTTRKQGSKHLNIDGMDSYLQVRQDWGRYRGCDTGGGTGTR
jgi:hypothetical protein